MNGSHREGLRTLSQILLRCWIIGFVFLLISFFALQLMAKPVFELQSAFFGIGVQELRLMNYGWLGLWKILIMALFLLPWLAINLVLRSGDDPRDSSGP